MTSTSPTSGHANGWANGSAAGPGAGRAPIAPHVLLVEPHDDLRATIACLLRDAGCAVTDADCAAAAHWQALRHHPTVAVVELVLSGQVATGIQTVRALRSVNPALEVVLVTSLPITEQIHELAADAGARTLLQVSGKAEELVEAVTAGHADYLRAVYPNRGADAKAAAKASAGGAW